MPLPNRDTVLLETAKTQRSRLLAAFLFGPLAQRRVANDNVKRLIGGVVLAATICAGCLGVSFVTSLLAGQKTAEQQQAGLGPATGPAFAADAFDRSVGVGWGSAELGGTWALLGPTSDYAVASGAGTMTIPVGESRGGHLGPLQDRSDLTLTAVLSGGALDGSGEVAAIGRQVSSTQDYRTTVLLGADGSLTISLSSRSDPQGADQAADQGTETLLSNRVILTGTTVDRPDDVRPPISIRMQTVGTNPTVLRAKAWPASGSEPADWTVTATDGATQLQRPGTVGVVATVGGTGEQSAAAGGATVFDVVARAAP